MSATATPATSDRSDFRTVMVGGTEIGLITAAGVVAFLVVSRQVTAVLPQQLLEALIVLATGVAVSFLPGRMTAARHGEGLAGAAAMGLWGTVVFMAVDIIALRPLKAYPWTWDAVGGGSTWWYLPIWWMLGTLLAWTGAIVTADQAARGEPTLVRSATPALGGIVVLVLIGRLAGLHVALPVATGAGFTITLAVSAVVALARKR
ncbi:MAG: hypothetical protein AUI99_00340 [Gemmatimonadetes bacterium 13_1_40CM_3_69_22]|nr:MAG: hypothetical protein AUI99_00340 [Gemmatimonadetes bacterium 13_1_40CM_3_69_22]